MPSNTPIVIADGAATPVNHTFAPDNIVGNTTNWVEVVSGVPVGYPKLQYVRREPVNGGSQWKIVLSMSQPKVITTTDTSGKTVTSVDYTNRIEINYLVDRRSTKQERKDLRVLGSNLLANATIASAVDDLLGFY